MSTPEVPWSEIDAAIRDNRLVEAIRLYRLATGSALAPAAALIQARQAAMAGSPPTAEATTTPEPRASKALDAGALDLLQYFENSAFCPPGGRIAAWRNRAGELCALHRRDAHTLELNVIPGNRQFGHDLHGYTLSLADLLQRLRASQALPMADFAEAAELGPLLLRQLTPEPARTPRLSASRASLIALDAARFEAQFMFRGAIWSGPTWRAMLERAARHTSLREELDELRNDPSEGPSLLPNAPQSRLLLELCVMECGTGSYALDHEAQFRDWACHDDRKVPLPLLDAFATLQGWLDVEGARRSGLPPWLDQATRHRLSVGLATPGLVRFLAPRWPDLGAHLEAHHDLSGMSELLTAAAGRGDYVLALAPLS